MMKKIRTGLALLIVLGFISTLVGGVGYVYGNPDGVTVNFEGASDAENYIASKTNLVVSGGQVKLDTAPNVETACADGIDNDGDGYTDAFDSDCACGNSCSCPTSEGSYTTWTCSGNTIWVDCSTDLCWSKASDPSTFGTENDAIAYCSSTLDGYGGKNGWYLPTCGTLQAACFSFVGLSFGGGTWGRYYWCLGGWDGVCGDSVCNGCLTGYCGAQPVHCASAGE